MPTLHILGNLLLICLAVLLGWSLSRRKKTALVGIGLSGVVGLASLILAIRPGWAVTVMPFDDLTFYDNIYPLAFGLFFPCVWHFVDTSARRVRMALWCALLLGLTLVPFRYNAAAMATSGGTFIDQDGVCIQSYDYNCSAASVVTLLRHYGVECTEAEAIALAGTKDGKGTEALGLYRALRHYESQARADVIIQHGSADALLNSTGPAIILVGLPNRGRPPEAAAYGRLNNWPPGFFHDVVYLGLDPDDPNYVRIADPDVGMERWRVTDIHFLYRGQAVRYRASE